jgi:cysteine-rich repeat protein
VVRSSQACASAALLALACACAAGSAHAQGSCQTESECRFKKPNVLLLLDYSSSMVGFEESPAWFPRGQTATLRWDAQLDAVSFLLRYDNGFFADNLRIGLARFAHDPDVATPATVLSTDTSFPPITDGFALDVPFDGQDGEYLECRSSGVEAEVAVLRASPPPYIDRSVDPYRTMLTWTRGALRSSHELITKTRASHAGEPGEEARAYHVVLMTDGDWTCPDRIGQSCTENEDPAPAAAALRADGVPVHVVAFGDATMQPSLNEVALQGGTGRAIDATSPQGIVDALAAVLDNIKNSVIVPECTASLPRLLVLMDGSSSMIAGSAPGETNWDKARYALAGNPAAPNPGDLGYVEPVLARELEIDGRRVAIEDVVHVGMLAFARADEQTVMVELGPCRRDNIAWAMDPHTSCVAPGCTDPYAGYPTTWTFQDSDETGRFVSTTRSFMPACNQTAGSTSCVGTIPNTFTGEGLRAAHEMIARARQGEGPYATAAATRYFVVLVTDGRTSAGSSNVTGALADMVADGIDSYVIGFGAPSDLDTAQLDAYAAAGNTGRAITVDPTQTGSAGALAGALESVVRSLDLDACCVLDDCSQQPEPPLPGPSCGDGKVEGNEQCDDGKDNGTYGHCGGLCDGPHLFCGDGRVDGPEECDDGNREDGDGCEADCRRPRGDGEDEDGGVDFRPPVVPPPPAVPPAPAWPGTGSQRPGGEEGSSDAGLGARRGASEQDGCGCRTIGARRDGAPGWLGPMLVALGICGWRRRSRSLARVRVLD